jgi:nucleoside-diphosphate-sugar epimerase
MKRILITGATGALGRALSSYLKGKEIYQVIATSKGSFKNSIDQVLDVTDLSQMRKCLKASRPDVIFHLAVSYAQEFDQAYRVNVDATRQLLEIVLADFSSTRVVLIGTAAEYGIVKAEDNPIKENFRLEPITTYGITKAWQTILMHYYHVRGLNIVMARIFNLYGTGISPQLLAGSVLKQIEDYKNGQISQIITDELSQFRDFISTDEAAKQLELIALSGSTGQVYHVGSGLPTLTRDLVYELLRQNQIGRDILVEDKGTHQNVSVGLIYADMKKTKSLRVSSK